MAWDEWERLKQDASQRQDVGMQLNQHPAGDGPGPATSGVTGGVKSTKKAWNDAGAGVGSLREGIDQAVGKLQDGQKGLGAGEGCLTAGAQTSVHASWDRYVKALGKRCDSVKGVLEKTGHDLLLTDEAVQAELNSIKTAHADTPAVGGQNAGR
ncbi:MULTISPECIES: hypothetical protein [Streptomyces]|uniref:hypothetical protein n=1 Tax=Streptomyces TaxID=1883 RepID=UPI001C27116C|nr:MULTISPECIES: hypothetical protein [Streptomyces]MDQ0697549.1 hypothetical protein [Streptomyces sp. W4I9-2]MDX3485865.1 hypothetical protein [Streptomyces sp. ID05-18]